MTVKNRTPIKFVPIGLMHVGFWLLSCRTTTYLLLQVIQTYIYMICLSLYGPIVRICTASISPVTCSSNLSTYVIAPTVSPGFVLFG